MTHYRPAKKRYHHGDLRRALVREAVTLLRTKGVNALSLRETARRAGVSQAAPYRHFADKQALVAAVAEEGYRRLGRSISRCLQNAANAPSTRLRSLGVEYVRFALTYPAEYQLMFGPRRPRIEQHPALHEAAHAALGHVLACLSDGQREGCVRPDDAMHLTFFTWTFLHGLSVLLSSGSLPINADRGFSPEVERLTRAFLDLLFDGLTPRAPRPAR